MKEKGGRRYPLLIYVHMMDRWRPWIFWLGVLLLALAGVLFYRGMERWRWMVFAAVGVLNILASALFALLRKSAYVQLFPTYMWLVTPFLRIKISYKRFRRSGPAEMGVMFPPNRVSGALAEVVREVARKTAVVIEFSSLPISQRALRMFLSPLFFKDKTPHLVILVEDWMGFSAELDSVRSGGAAALKPERSAHPKQPRETSSSILSKLPPKK